MTLATICPRCNSSLGIDPANVDQQVRCSMCGARFAAQGVSFNADVVGEVISVELPETADGATRSLETLHAGGNHRSDSTRVEFGRFQLRELLGEGTYGRVHRAFDPVLEREVALKIPKFGPDETRFVERFLREAKAAARLRHPNIVGVFESGQVGNEYYIASEFVDGNTLAARIESQPIDHQQAARICRDLANGLAYAHDNGVVHRDIKPGNVLVDDNGNPQLADFGLAKRVSDDATMTTEGGILGTPAYMPPEQARGELWKVGPASDQYSLGAVLYELLTGRRPFEGPPHHVIAKVAGPEPPSRPRTLRASIPRNLEAICLRALEKEPSARYRSVHAFAEDLDRWLEGRPVHVRRISQVGYLARWCRRNPLLSASLATTLGLLFALMAGALGSLIVQRDAALVQADKEKHVAVSSQRQLAINEFERGRSLCEQGDLRRGLLWLAHGLEGLSPDLRDLERPIRSYIASSIPHVHELQLMIPHDQSVNSVAISPDNRWLLSGSGTVDRPGIAQIWDLRDGRAIGNPIEHSAGVTQVACSPKGDLIATACFDKTVRLIDPRNGKLVHTLQHPQIVGSVAFSHDGKRIVTGSSDSNARIWSTETGSVETQMFEHKDIGAVNPCRSIHHIPVVRFNSDDSHLITLTCDFMTRVWNVATRELKFGPDFVTANRFVHLALASDPLNLPPSGPDYRHRHAPTSYSVTADGATVMTSAFDRTARIWDAATGLPMGAELAHNATVNQACFSPDETTVATAGDDRLVKVWRVALRRPNEIVLPHGKFNNVGTFHPGGKTIYTSCGLREPGRSTIQRHRNAIWNTENGQLLQDESPPPEEMNVSLTFNADGSRYACSRGNRAEIRLTSSGVLLTQTAAHPGMVSHVAFCDGDTTIATGCQDGFVRFWNRDSQSFIEPPLHVGGRVGWILRIEFSPDGSTLLTSGDSGAAQLWDWRRRKPLGEPIRHTDKINSATFHPNGEIIATAGDDMVVRFWSIPDGKPIEPALPHNDRVNFAQFFPDGRQLVTGGFERAIRTWDFETRLPTSRPLMHTDNITFAEVNSSGTQLASRSWDGTVRLWKIEAPVEGSPASVRRLLERRLGAQLGPDKEIRVLTESEWRDRRNESQPSDGNPGK